MINVLKDNQVFVFGSNLAGSHGAGAAKQAAEEFGAEDGVGEGLTGQCYAFPTLDKKLEKRSIRKLHKSVYFLYASCHKNPDKEFLLTKVGCGIAGYQERDMKKLFTNIPKNLVLPEDWR